MSKKEGEEADGIDESHRFEVHDVDAFLHLEMKFATKYDA